MAEQIYPIIINKSNYVNNSTFEYKFGSSFDMNNIDLALGSISMFYSWRNISALKGNNTFSIIHPDTTTTNVTLNLTLPDGGYEISDINNYIKYFLIDQGYYIQNSTTLEYTIYCELRINPTTYSIEYVSYPVPTSLPSGYTAGSSINFPSITRGPQLSVLTSNFGSLIGFAVGSFPSAQSATIDTSSSTLIPVLSDVQNVLVTVDSASNPFAPNSKIIHSVSYSGVSYSSLIADAPNNLSFVPQNGGSRNQIRIQLTDQNLKPLDILDTDITIKLLLRINK